MLRAVLPLLVAGALGCAASRPLPTSESPAEQALLEGQRALKESRTDEAIAAFRKALLLDPGAVNAMRGLVEAHHRSGRTPSVIAELTRQVASGPANAVAHYGLGLALFAQSAGNEQQAVEHLARAAALQDPVAEFHFRLGIVHLESERFPEAVQSLLRARDLAPNIARHHLPLALAQAREGNRSGSLASLRTLLLLSPDPREVETARGVMARLNDVFKDFPKTAEEEFQRGLLYMQQADSPQQAIVVFEEILERFPDLAVVHAALGLCYARIDNAGRAMDGLRRALELAPEDARNHLYLADLYASKERFDKAVEHYAAALERDPFIEQAYDRLGSIALQRGDGEQAARWLKTLIVLRPDDASVRHGYGMALMTAGANEEAERQFKVILERDPKHVDALLRLGMLCADRGRRENDSVLAKRQFDRAAGYFESVLDLQPQNVFAARALKSLPR